ncbi:MAG: hypothetical protein MHM6MM_002711 [Cercozoa sp. M6MM]
MLLGSTTSPVLRPPRRSRPSSARRSVSARRKADVVAAETASSFNEQTISQHVARPGLDFERSSEAAVSLSPPAFRVATIAKTSDKKKKAPFVPVVVQKRARAATIRKHHLSDDDALKNFGSMLEQLDSSVVANSETKGQQPEQKSEFENVCKLLLSQGYVDSFCDFFSISHTAISQDDLDFEPLSLKKILSLSFPTQLYAALQQVQNAGDLQVMLLGRETVNSSEGVGVLKMQNETKSTTRAVDVAGFLSAMLSRAEDSSRRGELSLATQANMSAAKFFCRLAENNECQNISKTVWWRSALVMFSRVLQCLRKLAATDTIDSEIKYTEELQHTDSTADSGIRESQVWSRIGRVLQEMRLLRLAVCAFAEQLRTCKTATSDVDVSEQLDAKRHGLSNWFVDAKLVLLDFETTGKPLSEFAPIVIDENEYDIPKLCQLAADCALACKGDKLRMYVLSRQAAYLEATGKQDEAISTKLEILKIASSLNDAVKTTECQLVLCKAYQEKKEVELARKHLDEAQKILTVLLHNTERTSAHAQLSDSESTETLWLAPHRTARDYERMDFEMRSAHFAQEDTRTLKSASSTLLSTYAMLPQRKVVLQLAGLLRDCQQLQQVLEGAETAKSETGEDPRVTVPVDTYVEVAHDILERHNLLSADVLRNGEELRHLRVKTVNALTNACRLHFGETSIGTVDQKRLAAQLNSQLHVK